MEAYTTHSLLEYARDFDHLLTMKNCEYTYPQRDIPPYTWRYDPNTSIGTILSASSFKGISFTHSGYMPVLEVIDGNETNETDNETSETKEVRYYVGDHCAFCFEKKGLGFPLNHDIKSTYRGGIEMLEKIDRLKFHQPVMTHEVYSLMSFMRQKNEDGIIWISENGTRIFSRGMGIEVLPNYVDADKETFNPLPIQSVIYLCDGIDGFAMAQDDAQYVFKDMTEMPRYVFVDKSVYSQKNFKHLKPDYFFKDAMFHLHSVGCFTVHVPSSGDLKDSIECDTVTISHCPNEEGKLLLTFKKVKGEVLTTVKCDAPFSTWLDKKLQTMHKQSDISKILFRGFDGILKLMKDQKGSDYIMLETTCCHEPSSLHPLAAMIKDSYWRPVHARIVVPVKVMD